jgi:hypothetical protein
LCGGFEGLGFEYLCGGCGYLGGWWCGGDGAARRWWAAAAGVVAGDRVLWKAKSTPTGCCAVVCSWGAEDGTTTGKVVGGDDAAPTVVGGGSRSRLRSNTGRELLGACSEYQM